jgi:hypothetical protein
MTKEIHDINTRALDFVVEIIDYIAEYPDDDYMTMECLCRKLVKHGLIDKVDGYYQVADRKTENSSEKPNNCEHITEDGVTCAKYPACDDCLDNPLNKVKGSERLLKGKDEPQTDNGIGCSKCESRYDCYDRDMPHAVHCNNYGKE